MIPEEYLYFSDQAAWHTWLSDNHAARQVVWLIFYKSQTGLPSIDYECAVEEAICFGWIDSLIKHLDDQRYARKFTRRTNIKKWSPTNIKRLKRLIAAGRMTPAGKAVIDPAILSGTVEPVRRAHQEMALSSEYQEILKGNPEAWKFFNSLPPSQKRLTIVWVMSAVKPETQKKRMEEVLSRMARGKRLGLK